MGIFLPPGHLGSVKIVFLDVRPLLMRTKYSGGISKRLLYPWPCRSQGIFLRSSLWNMLALAEVKRMKCGCPTAGSPVFISQVSLC